MRPQRPLSRGPSAAWRKRTWQPRLRPEAGRARLPTKTSQMSEQVEVEQRLRLLRTWHLAILRFALTRDKADRLGVLAIANEIDRLGRHQDTGSDFSFFRRMSTELCAAMLRRQAADEIILKRYLAAIDDPRLHRAMAAAIEVPQ